MNIVIANDDRLVERRFIPSLVKFRQ